MDSNDAFSNGQEILSQSDIERLLTQVAEQEASTEVIKTGGKKAKFTQDAVQPYDFRQPVFLSAGELRKLRLRQEDFARSLAARFSIYLRMEFGLQMSRLQTVTYQKFVEGLENPTHLTLFKAEPLKGVSILDIPTQLGVTIVDRLLGGAAHSVNLERDLSDIEAALLDQAVQLILNEWCNQWAAFRELRPVVLGHESNARFLQTASHDTVMLVLALEARLGDCQDTMQMGFPCYTLEPLMRQLSADLDGNAKEAATSPHGGVRWNSQLDDVRVPISASWNDLELTARQMSRLKIGDVLQLPPHFASQIRVCLARVPKFVGRLGLQDGKWAVQLNQVLKSDANPNR